MSELAHLNGQPVNMPSENKKTKIKRKFKKEWEKNWWARYALTYRNPDRTLKDHPEEVCGVWKMRDWVDCNTTTILHRLYNMTKCEREATNYLCGRVDGNVFIEHAMGVRWGNLRAQNEGIIYNSAYGDEEIDFADEEDRLRCKADKFPYGMEPFSAVSDLDYVKLWGGLTGFMSAFGINPHDSDAVLRAGQLIAALRKQGACFSYPQVDVKKE